MSAAIRSVPIAKLAKEPGKLYGRVVKLHREGRLTHAQHNELLDLLFAKRNEEAARKLAEYIGEQA